MPQVPAPRRAAGGRPRHRVHVRVQCGQGLDVPDTHPLPYQLHCVRDTAAAAYYVLVHYPSAPCVAGDFTRVTVRQVLPMELVPPLGPHPYCPARLDANNRPCRYHARVCSVRGLARRQRLRATWVELANAQHAVRTLRARRLEATPRCDSVPHALGLTFPAYAVRWITHSLQQNVTVLGGGFGDALRLVGCAPPLLRDLLALYQAMRPGL